MNGRCTTDPLDRAENICEACGDQFCGSCLLFPRGRKHPPTCKACAIANSGLRGGGNGGQGISKREWKKRVKQLELDLENGGIEEPTFEFFELGEETTSRKSRRSEVAPLPPPEPTPSTALDGVTLHEPDPPRPAPPAPAPAAPSVGLTYEPAAALPDMAPADINVNPLAATTPAAPAPVEPTAGHPPAVPPSAAPPPAALHPPAVPPAAVPPAAVPPAAVPPTPVHPPAFAPAAAQPPAAGNGETPPWGTGLPPAAPASPFGTTGPPPTNSPLPPSPAPLPAHDPFAVEHPEPSAAATAASLLQRLTADEPAATTTPPAPLPDLQEDPFAAASSPPPATPAPAHPRSLAPPAAPFAPSSVPSAPAPDPIPDPFVTPAPETAAAFPSTPHEPAPAPAVERPRPLFQQVVEQQSSTTPGAPTSSRSAAPRAHRPTTSEVWTPPQPPARGTGLESMGSSSPDQLPSVAPRADHPAPVVDERATDQAVPAALRPPPSTAPAESNGFSFGAGTAVDTATRQAADTDAQGNWIPPNLRGMAQPAGHSDELPKRRRPSD